MDLPKDAIGLGFSRSGTSPPRQETFTLNSGPQGDVPDAEEVSAFDLFWNKKFISHVINKAREIKQNNPQIKTEPTEDNLKRYVVYLIASGFVQYAEERLPWREDSLDGLFRNDFLTSLFTHQQLIDSKKLFRGDRDKMTEIFNETSKKHWIPHQ